MVKKRSNPAWDILSSVKLTIILLILLAFASILGTVIPQQEEAVKFIQRSSPELVRFFNSLQLFDMYHSIWFRLIISCLAINLVICSINRFPSTLKLFRLRPKPERSKPFEQDPQHRTLSLKGDIKETTKTVMKCLKGKYRNTVIKDTDNGTFLYCEKGRFSLFGVYLVHLSVLFILVGAIIGSVFGFNAYVNILENESVDTVILRKSVDHRHKNLGFTVFCDKFSVEFYDNGTPKEYRSDLSFIVDDNRIHKESLRVNHPIKFKGITFYQSSYGLVAGNKVHLRISGHGNETSIIEIEKNHSKPLPGNEGEFQVIEVDENLRGVLGPAALVSIKPHQGKEIRFWVLKDIKSLRKRFPEAMFKSPIFNPSSFKPYTFYLNNIETRYYTGLQVNRDPGVPLVYVGFFIIMVGLFLTFFTSHRRIWIRITENAGKIGISVAGKASKNPVGMERALDQIVSRLVRQLNPERNL